MSENFDDKKRSGKSSCSYIGKVDASNSLGESANVAEIDR